MNRRTRGRLFVALALALLGAAAAVPGARATVVGFDDLTGYAPVPAGYAGLTWDPYWFCADQAAWPGLAHSPSRFIFNRQTADNLRSFDFPAPVFFNGAWVAAYNMPYSTASMRFVCYGGVAHNVWLGSSSWLPLGATPAYLATDIDGVTRVFAEYSNSGQFLLDDLTYNAAPVPVVGETWGGVKRLFR